jgi:hypothetical protein
MPQTLPAFAPTDLHQTNTRKCLLSRHAAAFFMAERPSFRSQHCVRSTLPDCWKEDDASFHSKEGRSRSGHRASIQKAVPMPHYDLILSRRSFLSALGFAAGIATVLPASAAATPPLTKFAPNGTKSIDHSIFASLLRRFVKRGSDRYNRVDYRAFEGSGHADLKSYLAMLEMADPTRLSHAEAQAYWVNLYNAKTLDVVLDHYPVSSIKNINLGGGGLFGSGPWSKKLLNVDGTELSLDDIEHRVVRPLFADPMSHYGLNCASYSCPNLAAVAYTGQNIGTILSEGARDYINHERGLKISDGLITASKIYSWYRDDFGGEERLKPHWNEYAAPTLAEAIDAARIYTYDYDWSLNDV